MRISDWSSDVCSSDLSDTAIAPKVLTSLEAHDRAVAEAQAVVNAGATRIALSGTADGITIDGEPMALGARTLDREVHIRIGAAELQITPPASADRKSVV